MSAERKHLRAPAFGWKVKLDHQFPEQRNQNFVPSFKIIWKLLFVIIRYFLFELWCFIRGRTPLMEYIFPIQAKQIYGVPFGGIGGGTMGRGFAGEFCRFQLKPGMYEYEVIDADQFIVSVRNSKNVTVYQNVLTSRGPPKSGHLNSWKWNFPGSQAEYTAVYPRAWTEYFIQECNIRLTCRQVSPVIPHNYKDSSLPGGVFIWTAENDSEEDLHVTIAMCLRGCKDASVASPFEVDENETTVHGIKIENTINTMKCTFAFGVKEDESVEVTSTTFNPNGSGAPVWDQLHDHGGFKRKLRTPVQYFGEIACAVAAQTLVPKASNKTLEFTLVWHMPFIHFHNRTKIHERYYTKYFGVDKNTAENMCHYAINHYHDWEEAIHEWQSPILNDNSLPTWYKSAIFNELYFISDGGTIWLKLNEDGHDTLSSSDVRKEFGQFAYLEGHEYRMYNTYDVHFYASFALIDLWPKLQLSLQYDINDTISRSDETLRWFIFDGSFGRRKRANCVPHDIGDPGEEPFLKIDAYPIHDVSEWRDLNLKFVLQCYRDYVFTNDNDYLRAMWPSVKLLMTKALGWDRDGDGMIENGGFPDQTYDTWPMNGVSSYCGSLWLAGLCVTEKMASVLGDEEAEKKFGQILERATDVFTKKLWNGGYYDFDTASEYSKTIMADQLCGIWYLHASGIRKEILPKENVRQALLTIFEYNVKRFKNGGSGAVNGMLPSGEVDTGSLQSQEVWTGVTYALASHFIFQGMEEEGFATAEGIYETVYNRSGLGFSTPEALYETDYYRSVGYMRALSIWSMQVALRKREL